jgi:hypothetical protein
MATTYIDEVGIFLLKIQKGFFKKKVVASRLIMFIPQEEQSLVLSVLGRQSSSPNYYYCSLLIVNHISAHSGLIDYAITQKDMELVDRFDVIHTIPNRWRPAVQPVSYKVKGVSLIFPQGKFVLQYLYDLSNQTNHDIFGLSAKLDVSSIPLSSKLVIQEFADRSRRKLLPVAARIARGAGASSSKKLSYRLDKK